MLYADSFVTCTVAWGPNSPEVEETFDYASFLPALGEPVPFTLMTTSHTDEPVEEALWFAFYNGKAPDELEDGACPVVVVTDSAEWRLRVQRGSTRTSSESSTGA